MNDVWRFLPGPRQYVQRIVRDIKEGKNVVICLPEYAPYGLKQAIRNELESLGILDWTTCSLPSDDSISLESFICTQYVDAYSSRSKYSLAEIYENDNFIGRFFWVEGVNTSIWTQWKNFLRDYEYVCRTKQNCRQSLFCIMLEGELAISPPVDELCLASHRFNGVINGTDILIYASTMTCQMKFSAMQKQVAAAILANLSLWDIEICERLAEEKLDVICEPADFFRDIAKERNWFVAADSSADELTWQSGMHGEFNGKPYTNSVVLGCLNQQEKLAKRVWSAQAGVLLPFIEEKRSDLIPVVKRYITLPFNTPFGTINDLYELEIGHIEYQVRRRTDVDYKIKQELSILKEIRNALAHLEPVDSRLLLTSSIFMD